MDSAIKKTVARFGVLSAIRAGQFTAVVRLCAGGWRPIDVVKIPAAMSAANASPTTASAEPPAPRSHRSEADLRGATLAAGCWLPTLRTTSCATTIGAASASERCSCRPPPPRKRPVPSRCHKGFGVGRSSAVSRARAARRKKKLAREGQRWPVRTGLVRLRSSLRDRDGRDDTGGAVSGPARPGGRELVGASHPRAVSSRRAMAHP